MKLIRNLFGIALVGSLSWQPISRAQTSPGIAGIQIGGNYAALSITGAVSGSTTVYYTTNLLQSNSWLILTNLTLAGSPALLVDARPPALGNRFYGLQPLNIPTNPNPDELVWIQPGTFTMGSPTNEAQRVGDETPHTVTISRGFFMGADLISQADFLAVTGANPSYFNGDIFRPVERVSWFGATNYCALRTQQEWVAGLIPTNYFYRLPTEAEWEYACRAGTGTAFFSGNALRGGDANFDDHYEYDSTNGTTHFQIPAVPFLDKPTEVGTFAPNGWGLYDMCGNVDEWCQDYYGAYPAGPVADPEGPATGSNRVARGGGWGDEGHTCRSAQRQQFGPGTSIFFIGFRVVLSPR